MPIPLHTKSDSPTALFLDRIYELSIFFQPSSFYSNADMSKDQNQTGLDRDYLGSISSQSSTDPRVKRTRELFYYYLLLFIYRNISTINSLSVKGIFGPAPNTPSNYRRRDEDSAKC